MLPDWIEDFRIADEELGAAFEAMPPENRAWIKKTLAQLFACYDPYSAGTRIEDRTWRQGLRCLSMKRPLDWTLIWAGSGCDSPVRLAAAAALPVLAGVDLVVAGSLFGSGPGRCELLPALELAGVEDVLSCGPGEFTRLQAELSETAGCGALLVLGGAGEMEHPPWRGAHTTLRPERGALWAGSGDAWDYEAISSAHPGLEMTVWGPDPGLLPQGWRTASGGWEAFLAEGGDVLFVPEQGLREALQRCLLVLAPGQEGCWICPDLHPEDFTRTSLAWSGT